MISQPPGSDAYQTAWQDATHLIGAALGKTSEADRVVTELEARFAAVRAQYPQFAGKQAAIAADRTDAVTELGGQRRRNDLELRPGRRHDHGA